uniref:Agenet domain-containing protein n=1 Tax=Kalanchoe fedtschenkoi TaxID=63787 RepID=A0A7N0SXC8_KALFE
MGRRSIMKLREGERVEVSSTEEGFIGSYYEAVIVDVNVSQSSYMVRYKDLLKEDGSGALIEPAHHSEIRPLPPTVKLVEYEAGDVVDAFANDGWWVGVLVEKRGAFGYVRFDDYNKMVVAYPMKHIRIHVDWEDDEWALTSVRDEHRIKNVEFHG